MLLRTGDLVYIKREAISSISLAQDPQSEVIGQALERQHRERSWSFFIFQNGAIQCLTDEAIPRSVRVPLQASTLLEDQPKKVEFAACASCGDSNPLGPGWYASTDGEVELYICHNCNHHSWRPAPGSRSERKLGSGFGGSPR